MNPNFDIFNNIKGKAPGVFTSLCGWIKFNERAKGLADEPGFDASRDHMELVAKSFNNFPGTLAGEEASVINKRHRERESISADSIDSLRLRSQISSYSFE
ncbi:hypothetical protein YC2023_070176 [Brassica napus]